ENVVAGTAMTAGAAADVEITINGVMVTADVTSDAASSRAAVVDAINAKSGATGVTAIDTGNDDQGVTLVAADGRNITVALANGATAANTGLASADTYE